MFFTHFLANKHLRFIIHQPWSVVLGSWQLHLLLLQYLDLSWFSCGFLQVNGLKFDFRFSSQDRDAKKVLSRGHNALLMEKRCKSFMLSRRAPKCNIISCSCCCC
ncbi:hypothetical protein MTR67_049182 [Solanum verrucosum]|uniref:Uncharacterized protein n=1 Tax=Solanum verrucosum TaxID=315347 RepID=A0AAF0V0D8_SOLVR|nr:hypothetical protein MTR67_049182 [Solanum verrucosum]